ncbi:MAG: hypothetical protein CM1200mP16_12440 [Nitrospina sp.]|nr:MAG: hypothetical protein CM1200mP16_12440 [Nitrospina sp.]
MLRFLSLKLKTLKTKMAKLKLKIPVKRGDRLELEVETLASSGDGSAITKAIPFSFLMAFRVIVSKEMWLKNPTALRGS